MGIKKWLERRRAERVDGDLLLVIRDPQVARDLPAPETEVWSETAAPACTSCGESLEPRIITTDTPDGDSELWDEVPFVVDGFACMSCGLLRYPRPLDPERITGFGTRHKELAEAGRYREAEWWVRRITFDWPGWVPGHLDLAQVLKNRAPEVEPSAQSRLLRRAIDAYEFAIERLERDAEHYDAWLAPHAHLALAEAAIELRSYGLAERTARACLELPDLDDAAKARANEILAYLEGERWVFGDAAEVIDPYMKLMDRPTAQVESPEARKKIAQAVDTLHAHYEAHPEHWQSLFVAAMGLAALDEPSQALETWRKAWRAHPEQADIVREIGGALLRAELNREALEVLKDATERMPEDATLWSNRALIEVLAGDIESALSCIATSRQLDAEDPISRNLQEVLRTLDPTDLPRTMSELEARASA